MGESGIVGGANLGSFGVILARPEPGDGFEVVWRTGNPTAGLMGSFFEGSGVEGGLSSKLEVDTTLSVLMWAEAGKEDGLYHGETIK